MYIYFPMKQNIRTRINTDNFHVEVRNFHYDQGNKNTVDWVRVPPTAEMILEAIDLIEKEMEKTQLDIPCAHLSGYPLNVAGKNHEKNTPTHTLGKSKKRLSNR